MHAHSVKSDDPATPNTRAVYKPAEGERLLRAMHPMIQEAVGRPIWPCNSFARLAFHGAELRAHTDRVGLDWTVSINIQRDARWPFETLEGAGWTAHDDSDIDFGLLMCGRVKPHRRPPYTGERAYQVFLHYTEDQAHEGDRRTG